MLPQIINFLMKSVFMLLGKYVLGSSLTLKKTKLDYLSYTFFFFFFKAEPAEYGGFQATSQIRATAASLNPSHNNAGSKPHLHICNLNHSSEQCPLSEARDRTCNLMVTSRINFCYATMGTPVYTF